MQNEKGTIEWFAIRIGASSFGIFDVFLDEAGTGVLTAADPQTNTLVAGDEARIKQAFLNMQRIAAAEGATLRDAARIALPTSRVRSMGCDWRGNAPSPFTGLPGWPQRWSFLAPERR